MIIWKKFLDHPTTSFLDEPTWVCKCFSPCFGSTIIAPPGVVIKHSIIISQKQMGAVAWSVGCADGQNWPPDPGNPRAIVMWVSQPGTNIHQKPSFLLPYFDILCLGIVYQQPFTTDKVHSNRFTKIIYSFQFSCNYGQKQYWTKIETLQQNLTYGLKSLTLEKPNWNMITGWLAGWPETCGKVVICPGPPIFKMTHLKQIAAC